MSEGVQWYLHPVSRPCNVSPCGREKAAAAFSVVAGGCPLRHLCCEEGSPSHGRGTDCVGQ